jgi:hypothetical protein
MRKIVHKLRQKPEDEKRHILHITVFILALVLVLFWVLSLGRTVASPETKTKIKQDLKPFSILKDSVVGDSPTKGDNNVPEIQ